MRIFFLISFLFSINASSIAQVFTTDWCSESTVNGLTIQTSFPKGGPYPGAVKDHFNHSYLVFFGRIINSTDSVVELNLNFSADSYNIPKSPDTFVKLFLPSDTMTFEKQDLFSYGITELESLNNPTSLYRKVRPNDECLFYVVAFYYQTKPEALGQGRGQNRAEIGFDGHSLFYRMHPQIDSLTCGQISFIK